MEGGRRYEQGVNGDIEYLHKELSSLLLLAFSFFSSLLNFPRNFFFFSQVRGAFTFFHSGADSKVEKTEVKGITSVTLAIREYNFYGMPTKIRMLNSRRSHAITAGSVV